MIAPDEIKNDKITPPEAPFQLLLNIILEFGPNKSSPIYKKMCKSH